MGPGEEEERGPGGGPGVTRPGGGLGRGLPGGGPKRAKKGPGKTPKRGDLGKWPKMGASIYHRGWAPKKLARLNFSK